MHRRQRPRRLGADDRGELVEHQTVERRQRLARPVDGEQIHAADGFDAGPRRARSDSGSTDVDHLFGPTRVRECPQQVARPQIREPRVLLIGQPRDRDVGQHLLGSLPLALP
jgi:hypothetical protein